MRKIERESLSERTTWRLCDRTRQIHESASGQTTIGARVLSRKAMAKKLWADERTTAFDEIEAKLRLMAPGNGQCVYCESGEASHLDHFWPKGKYPARAYDWKNYLWACAVCNSNHKRDQFPTDERGQPLLINPADDEPSDHLGFSSRTGQYVGLTLKGTESIRVFGLDRWVLEQGRRDAWPSVQSHIVHYARNYEDDSEAALEMQRVLCRSPYVGVFVALLRVVDSEDARLFVKPACLDAIAAHPEIRGWI